MGRLKMVEAEENVACNLIPMIDIMFLLLLFFMLSADMTQRVAEDMVLPIADQAEEDSAKKEAVDHTVVNIVAEGAGYVVKIAGNAYTFEDSLKPMLKELAELSPEPPDPANPAGKFSSREIMVRAEADAPYKEVQRFIQMCGAADVGLYKIELVAVNPNANPNKP
ncbi:MAG: biopolymer transporter ExbD [Planctomycetes bacterium]|nr:biopolymer transporter ExbD [Planctomycetota bacterium]